MLPEPLGEPLAALQAEPLGQIGIEPSVAPRPVPVLVVGQKERHAPRPDELGDRVQEELDDPLDVEVGGEELAQLLQHRSERCRAAAVPVRHGRGGDRLPSRPVSSERGDLELEAPRAEPLLDREPERGVRNVPGDREIAPVGPRGDRDVRGQEADQEGPGRRAPRRRQLVGVHVGRGEVQEQHVGLSGRARVEGLGQRVSGPELQAAVEEPAQAGGQRIVAREDADGSHRATSGRKVSAWSRRAWGTARRRSFRGRRARDRPRAPRGGRPRCCGRSRGRGPCRWPSS